MSNKPRLPIRLLLIVVAAVLLILALLLTPLGVLVVESFGHVNAWVQDLPGIAWVREERVTEAAEDTTPEAVSGDVATTGEPDEGVLDALLAGRSLQEEASYEAALSRYREALERDEGYAPTYVALASVYMQLGREPEAIDALEHAAELAPDNGFIWAQLGQLYLNQDDGDRAVQALQKARALEPDDASVADTLGLAYNYRAFQDIENAVVELERAAELAPEQAEVWYHLSMAYVRRDDDGDGYRAIDALERSLSIDAQQPMAYYYLGQLYMQADEVERAVAAWQQFIRTTDDAEQAAVVQGWIDSVSEMQ